MRNGRAGSRSSDFAVESYQIFWLQISCAASVGPCCHAAHCQVRGSVEVARQPLASADAMVAKAAGTARQMPKRGSSLIAGCTMSKNAAEAAAQLAGTIAHFPLRGKNIMRTQSRCDWL